MARGRMAVSVCYLPCPFILSHRGMKSDQEEGSEGMEVASGGFNRLDQSRLPFYHDPDWQEKQPGRILDNYIQITITSR
ncbi:hypothetical protein DM02DRAFT_615165 [Periconia macrospinosa]|uniref:Uncharacterized protein n=1 Tax=Periconia macrospinosa TaxID=97972 RepID=A0A2V1DMI3_9PLEO|nr:hypothetical protein DM02DRAFT_615165 [Periconia macrospinosa]